MTATPATRRGTAEAAARTTLRAMPTVRFGPSDPRCLTEYPRTRARLPVDALGPENRRLSGAGMGAAVVRLAKAAGPEIAP